MRLTKHRKTIIETFNNNEDRLLSADDVAELLRSASIDLSTIYRNINALSSANYLSHTVMDNVTYYYLKNDAHHHLAVCTNCHRFYPIDCMMGDILNAVDLGDKMEITGHELMIYGICQDCQLLAKEISL